MATSLKNADRKNKSRTITEIIVRVPYSFIKYFYDAL